MISLVRSGPVIMKAVIINIITTTTTTIIIIIIITITTTTIIINHQHQVKYYTRSPQICEVSTNFLSNIQ